MDVEAILEFDVMALSFATGPHKILKTVAGTGHLNLS